VPDLEPAGSLILLKIIERNMKYQAIKGLIQKLHSNLRFENPISNSGRPVIRECTQRVYPLIRTMKCRPILYRLENKSSVT